MRKHAVKKLQYLLRCIPDQYETQQMCDKSILENRGALQSLFLTPDWLVNYCHALEFVPECYKTQKSVIELSIHILLQ